MEKDKKDVAKTKIDCGDADCPDPKRRPGQPRKTAVEANRAASSSSTIEKEKPPNQQSNDLASAGAPTFATPDNVKREPLTSTFGITNIRKPRRLWTVKASATRVGDFKNVLDGKIISKPMKKFRKIVQKSIVAMSLKLGSALSSCLRKLKFQGGLLSVSEIVSRRFLWWEHQQDRVARNGQIRHRSLLFLNMTSGDASTALY